MDRQIELMSGAMVLMARELCKYKNYAYEHPDNMTDIEVVELYLKLASTALGG